MTAPTASHSPSTVLLAFDLIIASSLEKAISIDGVDGSCSRRRTAPWLGSCRPEQWSLPRQCLPQSVSISQRAFSRSTASMRTVAFSSTPAPPKPVARVLHEAAAVPDRHGCVCGRPRLGRRLQEMGHDVRLMPPSYVKPYVKRGKTDAAAICEAVTRPSMRFVAVKSEACSSVLVLHRTRDLMDFATGLAAEDSCASITSPPTVARRQNDPSSSTSAMSNAKRPHFGPTLLVQGPASSGSLPEATRMRWFHRRAGAACALHSTFLLLLRSRDTVRFRIGAPLERLRRAELRL